MLLQAEALPYHSNDHTTESCVPHPSCSISGLAEQAMQMTQRNGVLLLLTSFL